MLPVHFLGLIPVFSPPQDKRVPEDDNLDVPGVYFRFVSSYNSKNARSIICAYALRSGHMTRSLICQGCSVVLNSNIQCERSIELAKINAYTIGWSKFGVKKTP